jgi:osmotically-inducible protein OsmY
MQFRKTVFASGIAVAMAALSGSVAADTASQNITEARQETQIWTTYALNPYLRASDLKVSMHAGTATLTGSVEEGVSKDLAKQIALGVDGVKEVDNQIVIKPDYVAPPRTLNRTYGEAIDDATITAAVKSKLVWSKYTDGLTIDVDTRLSKVKLTGKADTAAAKELAGRLAMNTRGVVAVDNQLVVAPAVAKTTKESAAEFAKTETKAVSDSWITTKVKSTFMYSNNVDGSDISVTTTGGIVTLDGKVDSGAERELAIELAKNVRGVKSVQAKHLKI